MQKRASQGAKSEESANSPQNAKAPHAEWLISLTICSPLPPSGTHALAARNDEQGGCIEVRG